MSACRYLWDKNLFTYCSFGILNIELITVTLIGCHFIVSHNIFLLQPLIIAFPLNFQRLICCLISISFVCAIPRVCGTGPSMQCPGRRRRDEDYCPWHSKRWESTQHCHGIDLALCTKSEVSHIEKCPDVGQLTGKCFDVSQLTGKCLDVSQLTGKCPDVSQLTGKCPDAGQLTTMCPDVGQLTGKCSDVSQLTVKCPDVSQLTGKCPDVS